MNKKLVSFLLAVLIMITALPAVALPLTAASPYADLYVESLYFTDTDGIVQIDPIGRKNMLPRVVISKQESSPAFAGKLVIEATNASGGVIATQTIVVGEASTYHTETSMSIDRTVFVGAAMDIPEAATNVRVKYMSSDGSEQYGNTAYLNPEPAGDGYVGALTFPEPFKSLMSGKFTISKVAGTRQYTTTMSSSAIHDWSDATEIFLSTSADYNTAKRNAYTGTDKNYPIAGRNFAENYKAGKYLNEDGSVENDFIFTLLDDFYSGKVSATGSNIYSIPLNNFGNNNNLKLGNGVAINALIRSGAPSGFTWMGSIKRQSDSTSIETKWTKLEGYDNVYYTVQTAQNYADLLRVYTLFDFETVDEYGMPRPYVLNDKFTDATCTTLDVNASLAAVEAAEGTFFQSADLRTIYCHPREGDVLDDIVLQWSDSFLSAIRHDTACSMQTIVFEDIGFMPYSTSHVNNQFSGGDFDKAVFGFFGCKFAGGANNTLGMIGKYTAYLNECVAAYGFRDNFNYHGVTVEKDGSRVIEVNCISYMNGDFNRIYRMDIANQTDTANANNASTAHDGMYMLRVGGRYWNSQGHHVGDTATKMTINVGIEAYDILATPTHGHTFGIGQTAQGWVIDCYGTGTRVERSIGSNPDNCYVLDNCGNLTYGINGRKYDLPTLTWAQIAQGIWNADESVAPEIPESGGTGGGNTGGGNEEVSVSASITIGATYGINIYLTPTGAVTAAGVKIGNDMLAGTLQGDGSYKITVATAYARHLLGTSVTYYPYFTTARGTTVAAEPTTVSAKTLLETYVAGNYEAKAKALAQAALDYATVAEAYFANTTVDNAVANRLAAYDATITGSTANTSVADASGSAYTFTAATLQLGDTVNFAIAIGAADGSDLTALPAGYKIVVDSTTITAADFKLSTVGGKKVMAVLITGVPEKEFAQTKTFLLKDGADNTLSTLTYSVNDFCIRALETANTRNKQMIRAIFAMGQAAAAYTTQ